MNTVCIFASDDIAEIEAIKNMLETHNIPTMIKNLYTQNVFGGLKLFTGHDAIAGSIQIFIREDDLEKGLELLKGEDELTIGNDAVSATEQPTKETDSTDEPEENTLKRHIYVAYFLSVFSFLIIPYFINIPVLLKLSKIRKTLFRMLLIFSTILMLFGLFAVINVIMRF